MATTMREATFTSDNKANSVARRVVKEHFNDKRFPCPAVTKSGPNKGRPCGGRIFFDVEEQLCACSKTSRHLYEAYQEPFGTFIHDAIAAIPEEERNAMMEADDREYQEQQAPIRQQEVERVALYNSERAKRLAAEECVVLELDAGESHPRPDGSGPEDGVVWSYRLGEWVPEERLRKRARLT
jgi:hypothetical protein